MQRIDRVEHGLCRRMTAHTDLQFVCQDIQQHLGIRVSAQVTAILANQELCKLVVVSQIAVVCKANTVGRIHVERLCFGRLCAPGRRVANVTNANVAFQAHHMLATENVAHQTVTLALLEAELLAPGHDARRVLAAVLQHGQGIIQSLIDWIRTNNSNHATHNISLQFCRQVDGKFFRDAIRHY